MDSDLERPLLQEDEKNYEDSHTHDDEMSQEIERLPPDADDLSTYQNQTNDVDLKENQALTYSPARARFVSSLIMLFYAMGAQPLGTVISQYLVHRWSSEANITMHSHGSVCFRNHSDPRFKEEDDIEARVSNESMYYSFAINIPAIAICIIMGSYSDVIGRRKIFLLCQICTLLKQTFYIFIAKYDLNTNFFYLGNVIEGLGGSYFVFLIASFSITADLNTHKSSRMLWINILMCIMLTISAIFILGIGLVIDHLGFVVAFTMSTIPIAISVTMTFFFMPETCPKVESRNLNIFASVGRVVKLYTSEGNRRDRIALFLTLLLFFFSVISLLTITSMDALYQIHRPLCWDAPMIGYYAGTAQGGMAIAGVLLQSIVQRFRLFSDEKLAMVGNVFQGGSYVLEAFVKNVWMMFLVPVVGFPGFTVAGILRGIMSVLAGPYNQGALFASIAVVEVLCSIASYTSVFQVYSATVHTMAGAVYLFMASLNFSTLFIYFIFFHFYDDPLKKSQNMSLRINVEEDEDKNQ